MFLRKFLWYFLYLCWDEPDMLRRQTKNYADGTFTRESSD